MEFTVAAVARRVREALDVPGPASLELSSPDGASDGSARNGTGATPSPLTTAGVAAMYRRLAREMRAAGLHLATDDLVFLVAAYDTVLGREPDDTGFLQFATKLQGGGARIRVVAGLTRSPEFAARHARAALHARLPFVFLWKIHHAVPGHWRLLSSAITGPVEVSPAPRGADLELTELRDRVVELQARHWEMASLVRDSKREVLEHVGRALASGGRR